MNPGDAILKKNRDASLFSKMVYFLVFAVFICLGILVYSNTLHSSFHFDDIDSIVNNSAIRHIDNIKAIWSFAPSRFVTYLTIALNYYIGRLNVFSYHIFNTAVHICSGLLVFWFCLLTLATPAMKNKKIAEHPNLTASLAGLIFLTHPIQTQGVTYIVQRAASMATMFYLLSLCLFVKFLLLYNKNRIWKVFYISSILSGIIAMFTKETAITLPIMMLFYRFCFFKNEKVIAPAPVTGQGNPAEDGNAIKFRYFIPFLIILLIIPLTIIMSDVKPGPFIDMWTVSKDPMRIPKTDYFLTQFRVIITYIRLLFLPINQNLDYDYPLSKSLFEFPVLASLLLITAILVFAVKAFRNHRLISFCIFWFFLNLMVESGTVTLLDVIFEHRLHLPMVGYSLFLVCVLYALFGKNRHAVISIAIAIIISYSIMTYKRNFVWRDEISLWSDVINKSPKKARAYYNRGAAYYTKGEFDKAMEDYNMAIELNSKCTRAYNNRGNAYRARGDFDQAIADYNKAIELNPECAEVYNNRGNTYRAKGNFDQAIADYNKAIELNPKYAEVYTDRGNAYAQRGKIDEALSDYNKAIKLNPNFAGAYYNRGNVYLNMGDFDEAIADYTNTIIINPGYASAYQNRGNAYAQKGEIGKALSDYNKAIKLNPFFADAYFNRGTIYLMLGNFEQAVSDYNNTIRLNPNYAPAYQNREIACRAMAEKKQ